MKPNVVLVVTGSRDADPHRIAVLNRLDVIAEQVDARVLFHGDCPHGADQIANWWARDNGIRTLKVPALWDARGNAAGPERNADMLIFAQDIAAAHNAQVIVAAFPLGTSRGTRGCMAIARDMKLDVIASELEA